MTEGIFIGACSLLLRHQRIEQFLTGIDAELLVDVAGVGLRGALGDDEFVGHAGKRLALSKQLHHLPFAWREAARFGHGGAATRQTRALVLLGWSLAHEGDAPALADLAFVKHESCHRHNGCNGDYGTDGRSRASEQAGSIEEERPLAADPTHENQRLLDAEQQKRTHAEALGDVAEEQKHDGVEEHHAQGCAETAGQIAADTESGAYELDAAAVQATVDRYNELCAKGSDDDFGKNPTFMRAIDTPPFIVVPHEFGMGLSAIIGGLLVNADNQVLKADEHTPIDGLFAVGNVSGCFYGGVDYPMDVLGLSIGRAITGGYLAGKHVAAL